MKIDPFVLFWQPFRVCPEKAQKQTETIFFPYLHRRMFSYFWLWKHSLDSIKQSHYHTHTWIINFSFTGDRPSKKIFVFLKKNPMWNCKLVARNNFLESFNRFRFSCWILWAQSAQKETPIEWNSIKTNHQDKNGYLDFPERSGMPSKEEK